MRLSEAKGVADRSSAWLIPPETGGQVVLRAGRPRRLWARAERTARASRLVSLRDEI